MATRRPRRPPVRARGRKSTAPRAAAAARPPIAPGSGLAPGMQAVNVYLAVANVAASMDFLERVLGFTRGVILDGQDGQARYAEMRHGQSVVMLVRRGDTSSPSSGVAALYTYVPDVDRAIAGARTAGAATGDTVDQPWGDRVASVTDPDGYQWLLATFKKLAPFE